MCFRRGVRLLGGGGQQQVLIFDQFDGEQIETAGMAVPHHTALASCDSGFGRGLCKGDNRDREVCLFVTWIHVLKLTAFQDWDAVEA